MIEGIVANSAAMGGGGGGGGGGGAPGLFEMLIPGKGAIIGTKKVHKIDLYFLVSKFPELYIESSSQTVTSNAYSNKIKKTYITTLDFTRFK